MASAQDDKRAASALSPDWARICAGALAVLGWVVLAIELNSAVSGALSKGDPIVPALVRYFSFFTIQTNILLALVTTVSCLRPSGDSSLLGPSVKAAAVVYIIIVGVVYAVLLSRLYDPKGSVLLANRIFHIALPILYPLYWLSFAEKGRTKWTRPLNWLIFPILYFIYILVRGAISDAYPYPFLNVVKLGYQQVILNALGLLAAFFGLGLFVTAIDQALAAQKGRARRALGRAEDF
jgi:hypothetical protein